jgi:hypothetical protein
MGGYRVCKPFLGGLPGITAPAAAGGVARKSAALFNLQLRRKSAARVLSQNTIPRLSSFHTGTDFDIRPVKAAFAAPRAFQLRANRRGWRDGCSEELWDVLYSVGVSWFSGAYSPLTGLGSTAGALSRLLVQQARRFGVRPYTGGIAGILLKLWFSEFKYIPVGRTCQERK